MAFVASKISSALKHLKDDTNQDKINVLFSGGISKKSDVLFPLIEKHLSTNNYCLSQLEEEPVDGALEKAKRIFESNSNHI